MGLVRVTVEVSSCHTPRVLFQPSAVEAEQGFLNPGIAGREQGEMIQDDSPHIRVFAHKPCVLTLLITLLFIPAFPHKHDRSTNTYKGQATRLGFRVQGSGFRVQGPQGSGFRVQGSGLGLRL